MKIIHINNLHPHALDKHTTLCVGNFDGIHKGHQELIKAAKRIGENVAVMTFYPHPEVLIKGISDIKLLTPLDEKISVFESMGVSELLIVNFNGAFMKASKGEFIDMLKRLKFDHLVCGFDFRFGYMAMGSKDDLKEHFDTVVVSKESVRGEKVSSSKIREALSRGDIEYATEALGREYHIYGNVVHGSEMGRKIGFRTANIDYKDFYLPNMGVYLVKVIYDNRLLYGMANIGHNPTMNLQDKLRLEVNIFEFDEEIYDKRLDIYFLERVRPEKKFLSVSDLILELERNKAYGMHKLLNK